MTSSLANTYVIDLPSAGELHLRSQNGDPFDQAYVVSGSSDPTVVINGATLDPNHAYVNRLSLGPGALAVTVADALVHHQFTGPAPFVDVVVVPWLSVAAERVGQANDSLVGAPIVKIHGPIPTQTNVGGGITCLAEEPGLLARLLRWIGRVALEQQVRDLLARGEVREARDLVESTAVGLENWWSTLKPPSATTRPASGPTDSSANASWLRDHAAEYVGQWVALRGGRLLSADRTRAALTRRLRTAGQLSGAFLVCLKD